MTDLERRLRGAMAASAEPAPAGLLEGIHRRHRRHHRRLAAACAAVVAFAVAGTLVSRVMLDGPAGTGPSGGAPAATGPAVPPPATPAAPVTAVAGTVLRDCQSSNYGTLGSHWKASSVHAGPVWFIYARPRGTASSGHRLGTGKVAVSAMIIAVANGHTAVVSGAPQTRGRFRFLAGFNPDGKPYTLAEGAPGLRLAGLPAGPGRDHRNPGGGRTRADHVLAGLRHRPARLHSPGGALPVRQQAHPGDRGRTCGGCVSWLLSHWAAS